MKDEPGGSFGERLRRLRQAAGLTQEQLAERAGLTAKGISALERGERRRPYRHTVEALVAALELPEDRGHTLRTALPAGAGISPAEVLAGLTSLLDKNLVVREEGASDEPRFGFLETIRAYAWEQLEAGGEVEPVRQRHTLYYRTFAEEAAAGLAGREQAFWLDRLAQEHDNLCHAFNWFLARADGESIARMGWSLWRFWYMRGFIGEGQR